MSLLSADPIVPLYTLLLVTGEVIRATPRGTLTFGPHTFNQFPITLEGEALTSSGEKVRPKMTLVNPDGLLSTFARQNKLEGAKITRQLVVAGAELTLVKLDVWYIYQITALNRQMITLELRAISDYPQTLLPPRKFYPPEFSHVSV